jgi:hypothetical protein
MSDDELELRVEARPEDLIDELWVLLEQAT